MAETKPLPQWLTKAIPSPVREHAPQTTRSAHDPAQDYLIGARGCLAIMSFLWTFLVTFAPVAVYASPNMVGPAYQLSLSQSLSVLFWNGSLIYSSIIFLSARNICIPFLLDSSKTVLASAVVRRGIRLWFPTAAALIICYFVFSRNFGNQYLTDFAGIIGSESLTDDLYLLPSSLANFNSIFNIFWVSHFFSYQAGNYAFPAQTLWIVTAVFQQSYTVYTTMVVIPFTRQRWRMYGAALFILSAWWVYSWAFYSITGLVFADVVMNMDFKRKCKEHRLSTIAMAGLCMAVGYIMMFVWSTIRPDLQNAELNYHTGLYQTGGVFTKSDSNDPSGPQMRADNWLVIVGFYILLESVDFLQRIFRNPLFLYLGRRSFSYFLLQSIVIYTLGIRTAMRMMNNGVNKDAYPRVTGVAFIICLLVTAAGGEVFYWLLDRPSHAFGRLLWAWLKE